MSAIEINSGLSKATISPKRGALLTSLSLMGEDLIFLPKDFSESASGWPGGGAPILFPFAGRSFFQGEALKYRWKDHPLMPMPLHGFAYAKSFEVLEVKKAGVRMKLIDDTETKAIYPFSFELIIDFSLTDNSLSLGMSLVNLSDEPMPVATGWHPFFKLSSGRENSKGMRLLCDAKEGTHVTANGAAGTTYPTSGPFDLGDPMYRNHILHGMEEQRAIIEDPKRNFQIELGWQEAPMTKFLVLWNGFGSEFFCVEPWMGLPDAVHTKIGLAEIPPGKSYHSKFYLRAVS